MSASVSAVPLLAARGVTKRFFSNAVLKDVSIDIVPGRIHALLGENGAGKSTLINLLSGTLRPDVGTILVDGREVAALTPREARRLGIAVVQQELSLAPHLSVAENVALGALPSRAGLIDYGRLAREAGAVCARIGLDVPLDTPVEALPLGRRQMVEIAKALFRRPRILILDEPTSSLTAHEVRILFDLLRDLRRQGLAILYISHGLAVYVWRSPGLLSITSIAKLTQSWFPLAVVAMAQTLVMLTGGIDLTGGGAMVSLGSVLAATLTGGGPRRRPAVTGPGAPGRGSGRRPASARGSRPRSRSRR